MDRVDEEESRTLPMDESLQVIFKSLVDQQNYETAMDFLIAIDLQYIPNEHTLKLVIFEILMKCTDARVLAEAHRYLCSLLENYPPTDETRKEFYYNVLLGTSVNRTSRNSELWNIFCHIMISCLVHYRVYSLENMEKKSSVVRYPGCNLLLNYYIKVISKSFEIFADQKSIYADPKKCLLVNIFWPSSEIGVISSNCLQLLKWINDVYKTHMAHQKNTLSNQLHNLLNLIVKFNIEQKNGLIGTTAFNSHALHEMCSNIMNNCKDVHVNWMNIKLFITSASPKYFQMKLCESKIVEMLYRHYDASLTPLTLQKILLHYMFCYDPKTKKMRSFSKGNGSKNLQKKKKVFAKKPSRGNTKLHELVISNKFADLLECMQESPDDINAKNLSGNTPLHEACLEKQFMCVKVLLTDTGQDPIPAVDILAVNNEGHTALHLAVLKDDLASTRELLNFGGYELLSVRDYKGRTAKFFAESAEMKKLMEEYVANEDEVDEISFELQNYGPPIFKSYGEYHIYLYLLNILLSYYTDLFHLTNWLKSGKKTDLGDHENQRCCHVLSTEQVVCSEDAMFLEKMNDLIENYIELVKQRAEGQEVQGIELELIPLKMYVAALSVPDYLIKK
ncbi:uncharacterized protein LOC129227304 [Uloborus diversus]|uniref:uncharacterized protein LOC129227304 n=1 Tax=Uloborus diversus TaxID=327109 RepID=UPI0024097D73|nr:uncharacterized protein LOC129227304 [Uloborus diversus]